MDEQRDLTGATVYQSETYPGAKWHVLPDGEVVLERPSGELDDTIRGFCGRPSSPVWYLDASAATSKDPAQPAADLD